MIQVILAMQAVQMVSVEIANMAEAEFTHTRISKKYLVKLKKLAKKNKRNAIQQLHYLIDEEVKK